MPTNHPASLKVAILIKLAQVYYTWHSVEAEAEAKALGTLKHLAKYAPDLARRSIKEMQTENKIGKYRRIQKENPDE